MKAYYARTFNTQTNEIIIIFGQRANSSSFNFMTLNVLSHIIIIIMNIILYLIMEKKYVRFAS